MVVVQKNVFRVNGGVEMEYLNPKFRPFLLGGRYLAWYGDPPEP